MKHLLHLLALIAILLISASAYSEGDGFQNFYVPLAPLDANEPVPKKVCDPNQDYYIECIRASTGRGGGSHCAECLNYHGNSDVEKAFCASYLAGSNCR